MEVKEPSAKYLARPRFKQTEIGEIPECWEVKRLGEIGESLIGLTYKPTDVRSAGVLVLRSSNIQEDSLRFYDNVFVDMEIPERIMVKMGDILICVRNGSRDLIGKCVRLDERAKGMTFGAFMAVFRTPANEFVYQQFRSSVLKRQINEHLGATINQITNKSLNSFLVPLPPTLAEQRAIAEALGDADTLIESFEQLLAKKRQVKQAAMQDLLTGKKRLPGSDGQWVVKRLGEIADIKSGGTPSTAQPQFWDGDVLWCTPTDITALNGCKYLNTTSRSISQLGLKSSSAELIPPNSIVMTSRATIGECAINQVPVTTNQGFKNFVPHDAVDVEFLYYLLLTQKQGFISLCGGSTFLEIGKGQLAPYEVSLPATKTEQEAIATILSDMDADLALIEEKLAKSRKIKRGMMQELLTGRIRLIDRSTPKAPRAE